MTERAVITGVGVCSALGDSFDVFLQNILQPQCAARKISCFEASTFGAPFAAEMNLPEAWIQEAAEATSLDSLALQIDRKLIFALRAIQGLLWSLTRPHPPSLRAGPPSPFQSEWRGEE